MKQLFLVFLGGGAGSALRYLISKPLNDMPNFPWGTFAVNILGSLLIGVFLGFGMRHQYFSTNTTLLLVTGFCGGFTTFSAFTLENQAFLRDGDYLNFSLYTLGTLILGIGAVVAGFAISR